MVIVAPGTELTLDGATIGMSPFQAPIYVTPGNHRVAAHFLGRPDVEKAVSLAEGETKSIEIDVPPEPVEAPPPPAAPVAPTAPTAPAQQEPRGPSTGILVAGAVTTGVGIVIGTVFTAIASNKGGDAATERATLVATGGPSACAAPANAASCSDLHGLLGDNATFSDAALASFVVAGTVGVGTLIYALVAPRRATASSLRPGVVVTGNMRGLVMQGVW